MSDVSEEQMSHADRHDLDKLARWKSGLDAAESDGAESFPVCAIFLVSPEDRASHDIFRRYRSAFEELGGGFHNLVIFGQHGVSTTQVEFLEELELEQDNVPLLAIAPMLKGSRTVHCIELPKGDYAGELDESHVWGTALESVRATAPRQIQPSLGGMEGVSECAFRSGSLAMAVDGVLSRMTVVQ